ncbi:ribulose-bisphosphate carboxylase-like protein; rubisco-like protein [Oceanicola granulosus HTCC2516]|uniref:Ribulose-bisphosphate carboxylase-like protein rubisco-like protein n=1 Tax=Oceanicola granulosus (strain ATCC BAA-861 / DSM 15982 / KCTC 12143 / HTCC2516) TaxID=314256 RepID=Q2CJ98_OCEGH|nr:RuBisCO large subunit C-terminal-like domain-containing protein [Oceanicola granulosus]EAR52702.1 ribulose-bisphosphate carboxylase-like protein; rubisco-like protein [Oceanicola granulosus HTCC2516]
MDRFVVTYRIVAEDEADAAARAASIALEDTVEIPRDVVPAGYVEDVVLGRVESVTARGGGVWTALIGYHVDAVGRELPQLLNVILGNASILRGVKAVDLAPDAALAERFPGARFGAAGVRRLTGRASGGFVCPVIKPQGSSAETLARLCYLSAVAGADIVKEDHGLANQDAAPFRERIGACAEAVGRANAERRDQGDTTQALYFANLCGPPHQLRDQAYYAKESGAHGILLIPGLHGFDAMFELAQDPDFDLPIMAHPSHLGPYVLSPDHGYGHGMLFGQLMRLAGADISVFPNHGGRFGFSVDECEEIVRACRDPEGLGPAILPSPGGGMSPERLPDMMAQYGEDCVYLLGGSLLRAGDRIGELIAEMRAALSGRD